MAPPAETREGRKRPPRTVADLKPSERNPRKVTAEQLSKLSGSMDRFGDLSGLVYNRRTGRLVGGHQRRDQLPTDARIVIHGRRSSAPNEMGTVAVGYVEVDGEKWGYREVDVDEATELAMNLAANRHGEGAWDFAAIPDLLEDIDEADFDLLGFEDSELKLFLDGPSEGGDFQELDPSIADDVRMVTCPSCGHEFPA